MAYKQRCIRCRKNYVVMTWKDRVPVCYDCQAQDLKGEVKDPAMRQLFDIPDGLYRQSAFLRDIKIKYLKYGALTDKQVAAFKKVADELRAGSGQLPEK